MLFLGALFCVLLIYPMLNPSAVAFLRTQPIEETGIEQSTWVFALAAGALALLAARLKRIRKQDGAKAWTVFGVLSILFFLDEISWGGRFHEFAYPHLFGEIFDGLHDIPFVIRRLLFKNFLFHQKLALGFALAAIAIAFLMRKKDLVNSIRQRISGSLPAKLILLGCILLFLSQIIDLQIIPNPLWNRSILSFLPPTYVEESLECLASLSFLLASIEKLVRIKLEGSPEAVAVGSKDVLGKTVE